MTPQRYQQLCELFDQATQRPASERAAFVEQACAGDPSLRADLEKMLRDDHQASAERWLLDSGPNAGVLPEAASPTTYADPAVHARAGEYPACAGDPATTLASPAAGEPDDPLLGQQIGPYLIQEQIGSGGMGSVYRALREDAYRQQVAVKVIRPGLDSGELLRRFRTERQVLAELQHPHIARLLDGGSTGDGRRTSSWSTSTASRWTATATADSWARTSGCACFRRCAGRSSTPTITTCFTAT